MKWEVGSGVLIELWRLRGKQNPETEGSWVVSPRSCLVAVTVGFSAQRLTLQLKWETSSVSREQCPWWETIVPEKLFFFTLWWRIWSFSYSFAQWKENCHFLVYDPHLPSFQICAKEVIMSPELPWVRLTWDSNYGRKQNTWTLRLFKCSAVPVNSQMASS